MLPPGVAFVPTDHEVIVNYLFRKSNGLPLVPLDYVIDNCDIYNDESVWMSKFFETNRKELFFFSKLRKKFNRGSRIDRVSLNGTWKESHSKKILYQNKIIGTKHFLKFIPKKGCNIEGRWLMDEFRIAGDLINSVKDTSVVFCKIALKKPLGSRIGGVLEGFKTLEFAPSTLSSQNNNESGVKCAPVVQTATSEPFEQIEAQGDDISAKDYLDEIFSRPAENLEVLLKLASL